MSKNRKVIFLRKENGDGQGEFYCPDGSKYVGGWKDGERHGQGTETLPDGRKYEGKWKDGKPWNGTSYNKNGNIIDNYVNGVIQ